MRELKVILIGKKKKYVFLFSEMKSLLCLVIVLGLGNARGDAFDEEQYGVKYASDCEVCKIVSKEFVTLLKESSGKHEVLETGYSVQVRRFFKSLEDESGSSDIKPSHWRIGQL